MSNCLDALIREQELPEQLMILQVSLRTSSEVQRVSNLPVSTEPDQAPAAESFLDIAIRNTMANESSGNDYTPLYAMFPYH